MSPTAGLHAARWPPQVRQTVAEHQQQLQRRYQLPGAQEQAVMRCARPPVAIREAPLCEQGGLLGTEAFLAHLQELPWYDGQVGGLRRREDPYLLLCDDSGVCESTPPAIRLTWDGIVQSVHGHGAGMVVRLLLLLLLGGGSQSDRHALPCGGRQALQARAARLQ